MTVYAVVYRDDTNGEAVCLGVTKSRESAVRLLEEKLETLKREIGDDSRINSLEIDKGVSWTVNYNEAYVDTCEIQGLELSE